MITPTPRQEVRRKSGEMMDQNTPQTIGVINKTGNDVEGKQADRQRSKQASEQAERQRCKQAGSSLSHKGEWHLLYPEDSQYLGRVYDALAAPKKSALLAPPRL
ncbi:hypothetical protein E2C01_030108 [Portunus trituberculatus]|uniref:Uncharacterized protein n=1 Tax=Portunus trituberculatus TaxID=210409 RepID=A0A5B7EQ28_PORTR|nr:hypothetical protein [Portunus trituberculatus]